MIPLDSEIIEVHGSFRRVRYWFHGWHPDLCHGPDDKLIHGLTGRETVVVRDELRPLRTFTVAPQN